MREIRYRKCFTFFDSSQDFVKWWHPQLVRVFSEEIVEVFNQLLLFFLSDLLECKKREKSKRSYVAHQLLTPTMPQLRYKKFGKVLHREKEQRNWERRNLNLLAWYERMNIWRERKGSHFVETLKSRKSSCNSTCLPALVNATCVFVWPLGQCFYFSLSRKCQILLARSIIHGRKREKFA